MHDGAGRIAGGVVLLIALWIGVYWWWPSGSKITFAQSDDAIRGVTPKHGGDGPIPQTPVADVPTPQLDPSPGVVVVPPEFTQYTVRRGDTFASIAKHFFGSAALAPVIAGANPYVSPPQLTAGRTLLIPKDPNNIQGLVVRPAPPPSSPPAPASKEYVVQPGDSLTKIAQEVYGDSRLSTVIFEANQDQLASENAIKAGQRLKIPPRPQR